MGHWSLLPIVPPDTKMLIWDFDGTLAYRQGKWSGALVDVLDIAYPDHNFISDHFRPHIQRGFPWHHWERTNEPDLDPSLWWKRLTPIFKRAYMLAANYPETEATQLTQSVRECYLNQNRWKLFDDVVPVLSLFLKRGYRQVVLSNHVPELNQLLAVLGIASFFERVFNSAVTGIEKPNPAAFLSVKAAYPEVSHFTMIGDSATTDISGAEAVGIPAVLVRGAGGKAKRECFSLLELRDQMTVEAESWNIELWSG